MDANVSGLNGDRVGIKTRTGKTGVEYRCHKEE